MRKGERALKKTLQEFFRALHDSVPSIPFRVRFWDNDTLLCDDGQPSFLITFKTKESAGRIFREGSLGFGEEYMAGNIIVEGNFKDLMRLGTSPYYQNMQLPLGTKLSILINHFKSLNTLKQSPRNISTHYDRGNEFYKLWLDESMTYSCSYFRTMDDTLEKAQQQKYEHICRKLRLRQGETLLDIGCGWGGMLIYAAKHYGVTGLGCTLSSEQAQYAKKKVREEGLGKNIDILLEDYRNINSQFNKVVSIGMFEHVGRSFIPVFMKKMWDILEPGGMGLLHTIGKDKKTPVDSWTMKYIFPGGYIPILDRVIRAAGETGFVVLDIENLRLHYAFTLDKWAQRFETNARKVEEMFNQSFVRMWRLYLNGCAAAFRDGDLRLYQILFTRGINNNVPLTREHLYH